MPRSLPVTLTLDQALDVTEALAVAVDELETLVAHRRRAAAAAGDQSGAGEVALLDQAALKAADALLVLRDALTATATSWNEEQRARVSQTHRGDALY